MNRLLIEVECGEKDCGTCRHLGSYIYCETGSLDEYKTCEMWGGMIRNRERLPACLAAERAGKGEK